MSSAAYNKRHRERQKAKGRKFGSRRNSKQRAEQRARLLERQGGLCFYCDEPMEPSNGSSTPQPKAMTFDHIVPRAQGGGHGVANLVLACFACNRDRGDMPADEFLQLKSPKLRRLAA